MDGPRDINTPFLPFLLGKDEKGVPAGETQPVNEAVQARDTRLTSDNFLGYKAKVADLRLLKPYAADLQSRLGDTCFVLQCRPPFSLDSVPDEWKHRTSPLLWEVKLPNSLGYVADSDLGTFYFKSEADSAQFVGKMNEADSGPSLTELLKQRDRLRKLLG